MTIYDADFSNIKQRIIDYLKTDETFNSYNYEDSAITNIINILSYIEQGGLFYLNNTANEFFIQNSIQTKNIYKNAKKLNYFPIRKSAGYINVTLTSTTDMIVPMFSQFSLGSNKLSLMENVTLNTGNSRTATVRLYEGEILTETAIVDSTDLYTFTFATNYSDIDNDHVYVYIDVKVGENYPESSNLWVNADLEILETNTNSYFTTFTDTTYSIQFDNGRIFNVPNVTDRVRVKYLKTSGSSVNGASGSITTDIANLSVDSNSNLIVNGTDEETSDEIKVRAPLFHSSQNRAVTERDWNAIIKRYSKYSIFKDSLIWGGDKENVLTLLGDEIIETPDDYKNLGRVIISTIKSNYDFLTTEEITELTDFLEDYKIAGLKLRFLHPNVYTITPTISIKTNPSLTFSQTDFKGVIDDYLDTLEGFNKSFYKSKLTKLVNEQNSIIYSDFSYTTTMRVKNENYKVIRLGSEITPSTILGTIDGLTFNDNGTGILRYDSVNVGTVNYTTGFMIITSALSILPEYEFSFTLDSDLVANSVKESIFNFEPSIILNL